VGETADRRTYLVECYWPGVDEQKHAAASGRASEVARELRRQGHDLHFWGSILISDDETVLWLYDGVAADVRAATDRVGVECERVLESQWLDGDRHRSGERAALAPEDADDAISGRVAFFHGAARSGHTREEGRRGC
jgi:hypothetical protein